MAKLKENIEKISNNPIFLFLSGLASLIGLFVSFISENVYVNIITICFIGFALLIICLKSFNYIIWKKKAKKIDEIIQLIERQNNEYKKCFNSINHGLLSEYSHLDTALKPYIDCVAQLSEIILGKRGSVCIKMIETQSIMNIDINNWRIRTIARSQSTATKRMRKDGRSILISDNSDFNDMLTGMSENEDVRLEPFVVPNLPELIKTWATAKKTYKNSTKDFLKCYKSTMVFPIATEKENVSAIIKNNMTDKSNKLIYYHVIGFLCWDYKDTFDTNDENFSLLAEILESFADILYPLLESYIVMQLQGQSELQVITS